MKKIISIFTFIFSILLFDSSVFAYEEYKVGDKVQYKNEEYYVIANSDSNTDYITLLKSRALTVEELYKYGRDENDHLFVNEYNINPIDPEKIVDEYRDGTGGMSYYTSETCRHEYIWNGSSYSAGTTIKSGCTLDYADSDVKKVIDNWSNSFSGDLKEVNGYKARILNFQDLIDHLGYELSNPGTYTTIHSEDVSYDWLVATKKYKYWTMETFEDSDDSLYVIFEDKGQIKKDHFLNKNAVRPVINLKKCALGDKDGKCSGCENGYNYVKKYKDYKIGDTIDYKGDKYYVIEESGKNKSYVTLLKSNPLTQEQIDLYSNLSYDYNPTITSAYYMSSKCYGDPDTEEGKCSTDYHSSTIKIFVDKWVKNKFNDEDLVEVNGYKARLMTKEEFNLVNLDQLKNESFWLMDGNAYGSGQGVVLFWDLHYSFPVKPVINLLKDKLGDQEEYKVGDIVTYNNDNYFVIEDSDESKNYLVLLKEISLKQNDIRTGEIGIFPYYTSLNCNSSNSHSVNYSNCIKSYDNSNIKDLVNNWVTSELNVKELVEIDGYRARLITVNELIDNLGYEPETVVTHFSYRLTDYVPSWVYDGGYSYWTMSPSNFEYEPYVYNVSSMGFVTASLTYNKNAVRPVINLDKCAIEGGCWEEDVCAGDDDLVNAENETVNAGNTLSTTSTIIIIVSIIFIVGGLSMLLFNYNKSKKEKKNIKNNTD